MTNLCNSCTNIGCDFQSGIVRTECAFYMPPTVNITQKADYEARLKADMVASLDKIREEIKALSPEPTAYDVVDGNPIKDAVWETLADVLQIIDKYKAESEG